MEVCISGEKGVGHAMSCHVTPHHATPCHATPSQLQCLPKAHHLQPFIPGRCKPHKLLQQGCCDVVLPWVGKVRLEEPKQEHRHFFAPQLLPGYLFLSLPDLAILWGKGPPSKKKPTWGGGRGHDNSEAAKLCPKFPFAL